MDHELIKTLLFVLVSLIGIYILYNDSIFLNVIYSREFREFPNILAFL